MAKRTISMGSYEEPTWDEYTGPELPANRWYTGEVVRCSYRQDKDDLQFIVEVRNEPDYEGWGKGYYAPLDDSSNVFWKTQEMIRALQGGKLADVTLDWENPTAVAAWLKKQKLIRFQTEAYGDEGRISIRKVRPLLQAASTPAAKASTPATKAAPEPVTPDPVDDEALEDYTQEELEAMTTDELVEILAEEFEVPDEEMPTKPARDRSGSKYKALLVEAILDEQEEGEDGDGQEGAEGDDGEGDEQFEDGFPEDADPEPEPEPEPEPAPARTRRTRGAAAKPAPEPEPAPAPAARTRRRRG